jgi:hypothetical protein
MELAPRQLDSLDAGMTVECTEFRTRQLEELEACVERTTEELGELEGNDELDMDCYPESIW